MKLTANQEKLITVLGVSSLEEARSALSVYDFELPNRITKDFIATVQTLKEEVVVLETKIEVNREKEIFDRDVNEVVETVKQMHAQDVFGAMNTELDKAFADSREKELFQRDVNQVVDTVKQIHAQDVFGAITNELDKEFANIRQKDIFERDVNKAVETVEQMHAQDLFAALFAEFDALLKSNTENGPVFLDYVTDMGKTFPVKFVSFKTKQMIRRSPQFVTRKGRELKAYVSTTPWNVLDGDENIKAMKIVNLDSNELPFHVSTKDIDIEDLKVVVLHNKKHRTVSIHKLQYNGVPLTKVLSETPEKGGKEQVAEMNQHSTTLFYHQNNGIGNLVPLAMKNGQPVYFQNDEYGNAKAMFSPISESEGISTLTYEVSEEEISETENIMGMGTQSPEGMANAMDASRLREVYAKELLALAKQRPENEMHEDVAVIDQQLTDFLTGRFDDEACLYYSMGKYVEVDERGTPTVVHTGLPELVYIVKDLPARKIQTAKGVRYIPEVLVMGEDSRRLYITSPNNLYAINGKEDAGYLELRYKWTNPVTNRKFVASENDVMVHDFHNMDDIDANMDYYNNYQSVDTDAQHAPVQEQNNTKEVMLKAEHVQKHKLDIPQLDYKIQLTYNGLTHGAEIATISFERNNVTYVVRYVYNSKTKAVEPIASWKVETDTSKKLVESMKNVVGRLWNTHKPQQQQKQA